MELRVATVEDARGIAEVHVQAWRETYAGLMPDSVLKGLSVDRREEMWRRSIERGEANQHMVVVELEGRVVGFCAFGPNREDHPDYGGEIYAIYLLRDYHRQGLGRKLWEWGVERLAADGIESYVVWVLEDNPTCGFYERMGGVRVAERTETVLGALVQEVGFGFR